jgi:hypothetical protein
MESANLDVRDNLSKLKAKLKEADFCGAMVITRGYGRGARKIGEIEQY